MTATLAASLFHFGRLTIPDLKDYLAAEGVPVRWTNGADAARHAPT